MGQEEFVFPDEKIFIVGANFNSLNYRMIARNLDEKPEGTKAVHRF